MRLLRLIIILYCSSVYLFYSNAMANEEAKYEIVQKNEIYEVRKYSDRLAVETFESNQNSGFRKLFNYISGNNKLNTKISMTTPVTRIKKNGNMTMQFYLPSKFNQESAPDPSNNEVKLVNVEGGYYAVIRYSGRASDKNFIKHKEILEKTLIKNNISMRSPPIRATYDSPFTLPMNRRNEAMFKIKLN